MSYAITSSLDRFSLESLHSFFERLRLPETARQYSYLPAFEREDVLGEEMRRQLKAFSSGLSRMNRQLDTSHRQLLETLGKAVSLQEALQTKDNAMLGAMVQHKLCKKQDRALETLARAREHLVKGEFLKLNELNVEKSLDSLSKAARESHLELAMAERQVLGETTEEALKEKGYQVSLKRRPDGLLLRATKGDVSIAAQVDNGGQLSIDMAGFEGPSCKVALEEIHEELERRGVTLKTLQKHQHDKKEGSVLIRQVEEVFNPIAGTVSKPSISQVVRRNLQQMARRRVRC